MMWTITGSYERDGAWYFGGPTKSGEMVEYGPWKTQEIADHNSHLILTTVVARHNWREQNGK